MPLSPPPRDANGEVVPHDHQGILPNDGIIRRVSEQQIVFDPKIGGKRLSSAVLNPSSGLHGGLSVDLQKQIEEAGLDAMTFVTTPRWMASIRFEASQLRDEEFKIGFDPLDDNPFHGEVWGTFSKAKIKRLFQLCNWFLPLSDTSIQ